MAPETQPEPSEQIEQSVESTDGLPPGARVRVDIETFEGPFDLLLHLVRVDEMDVFDINIADITERYLAHLAKMEECDLEIAGEFLVMAATLINIKSRTLLPVNPHVEEEDEDDLAVIQTTADLVRQLIEYRRFKEIAQVLSERELAQMRVFYRTHLPPPRPKQPEEEKLPPQDLDILLGAFTRVIDMVEVDRHHEIFDVEATVEDALSMLRERIHAEGRARFSDILRQCRSRMQMIVTVLALLEMSKLGEIRLEQGAFYEDIHIAKRDDPRPSYDEPVGPQPVTAAELAREERIETAETGENG